VTITNRETGMDSNRRRRPLQLPQPKSGNSSVNVEAPGFELQWDDNVFSGSRILTLC